MLSPRALVFVPMMTIACRPMSTPAVEGGAAAAPREVTISLDRSTYAAGGRVEMRVTNHTGNTFGFNPCTRSVERRQGNAWITVPESGRVCTMELWLLNPHASRTGTTELPASLARGSYRLALTLTRETTPQEGAPPTPPPTIRAVSGPFQVE